MVSAIKEKARKWLFCRFLPWLVGLFEGATVVGRTGLADWLLTGRLQRGFLGGEVGGSMLPSLLMLFGVRNIKSTFAGHPAGHWDTRSSRVFGKDKA